MGQTRYVRNQKAHHGHKNSKLTFEQEYTHVLKAYGYADFKRKYVFPDEDTNNLQDPIPTYQARRAAFRSTGPRDRANARVVNYKTINRRRTTPPDEYTTAK